MLHRDEIIQRIVDLLHKASAEDLKLFLIFIETYLRRKT